ncbi:MAG: DUF6141 family protein [Oscillatoriaceae bacterium SKW80]|nr:DUF6141 family protein [Oscillatoriaceae bacterium SKYG93]MCX8122411.1 DUF6141 family protein [Oscillatoriaceae bacterium SKW80]MDW8452664.1 DUF6141 family protein [Oscillatoriaceae cyanobacterium SKYGB_i_bin93]HIK28010.1 hypothetical protein [Oscillatoriaceae cyanobacterium M7585_C2015_266]
MKMLQDNNLLYQEIQQFRQPWLWLMLFVVSALSLYTGIYPIIAGNNFTNRPLQDIIIFLFGCVFGIGLPLIFFKCKLITEVRKDGVYISFFPLLFSVEIIPFYALKSYTVKTYRPLRDYGGWGIRYGRKGKAFNVSGNRGIQLELINGERILIGSRSPEAFVKAIETALTHQN